MMNKTSTDNHCTTSREYSCSETLVANLPYILMTVLGTVVLAGSSGNGMMRWLSAVMYSLYSAFGTFWVMRFICPYCHFHGRKTCPCGYGQLAVRFTTRRDGDRFAEKFRRHIPIVFPLWFVPPVVAGIALWQDFSWTLATFLAAFAMVAFILLPLVSRKHCCSECPQLDKCPWMGKKSPAGN